MVIAITREVSPAMQNCELTHLTRQPIDIELARLQHAAYEAALAALGCQVQRLPAEPDLPDSVFVEDAAVIFPEVAIITRPGAASRRPETASVARALQPFRRPCWIEAPGTVDGGDVLCVGKKVYVGLSSRSNAAAIAQMQAFLSPFGYTVQGVDVHGFLHLKSAVTQVAEDTLLINPAWVGTTVFGDYHFVEVDPLEPYAANALWIGAGVIYPANFPRTQQRIEKVLAKKDMQLCEVDVSELQKAEGAVTCCSLVIRS
jgi:dimethylargininase